MLYRHFPRKFSTVLISEQSSKLLFKSEPKWSKKTSHPSRSIFLLVPCSVHEVWTKLSLNDTRKFTAESFETVLFTFISNLNAISKINVKNSPLRCLFEFAYPSWAVLVFLGTFTLCKIDSSVFICGRKKLWKIIDWNKRRDLSQGLSCFPCLLSTGNEQRSWDRWMQSIRGLLTQHSVRY